MKFLETKWSISAATKLVVTVYTHAITCTKPCCIGCYLQKRFAVLQTLPTSHRARLPFSKYISLTLKNHAPLRTAWQKYDLTDPCFNLQYACGIHTGSQYYKNTDAGPLGASKGTSTHMIYHQARHVQRNMCSDQLMIAL